jgi:uncharacterized protein
MIRTKNSWTQWAVVMFVMVLLCAGCRSAVPPTAFYTLSSIRGTAVQIQQTSELQDMVIGVGPAQFPDYLDRPQIVTRSGSNRLTLSEFNRWGGKLDQDFLNIFAENISILLSTNRVVIFPWKGQMNPNYRVALDIHQFEGQNGDSVLLNVTWTIRGKDESPQPLHVARTIINQPVDGQGYESLISAYSQAVAELSGEVASVIRNISEQTAVKNKLE